MKYITLEQIKRHLNVEHEEDDDKLSLYGDAAEDILLFELEETDLEGYRVNGKIPNNIIVVLLVIVGSLLLSPEGVTPQQFRASQTSISNLIQRLKKYKSMI